MTHEAFAFESLTPTAKTMLTAYANTKVSSELWRKEFSEAAIVYCSEVSKRIPRNSPREDEWIKGEFESYDFNRIARVMDSVEFSRKTIADAFEQCGGILRSIRKGGLNRVQEAVLWAKLARNFNDTEGLLKHGARLGIFSEKPSNDPHALQFLSAVRLGVLERGVLELLEGRRP